MTKAIPLYMPKTVREFSPEMLARCRADWTYLETALRNQYYPDRQWASEAFAGVLLGAHTPEEYLTTWEQVRDMVGQARSFEPGREAITRALQTSLGDAVALDGKFKAECDARISVVLASAIWYGLGTERQVVEIYRNRKRDVGRPGWFFLYNVIQHPAMGLEAILEVAELKYEFLSSGDLAVIAKRMTAKTPDKLWMRFSALIIAGEWVSLLRLAPGLLRRMPRWLAAALFLPIGREAPDIALQMIEGRARERLAGITLDDFEKVTMGPAMKGDLRARAFLALGRLPDDDETERVLAREDLAERKTQSLATTKGPRKV